MAKGDKKKVQTAIDYQGSQAQNTFNQQNQTNQNLQNQFGGFYGPSMAQGQADYGNIMGGYQNFLGPMPSTGRGLSTFLGPTYGSGRNTSPANNMGGGNRIGAPSSGDSGTMNMNQGDDGIWHTGSPNQGESARNIYSGLLDNGPLGSAISGYMNFSNSGGLSPEDISNIRARAIAPIRGIYSSAQRETNRAGALNPGLTNIAPAQAKMAREMSYALGDKATDAEGMIAEMLSRNKLSGLGGLSSTGLGMRGQDLSGMLGMRGQDLSAILGGGSQTLEGLGGMRGLYGTAPGMAGMLGNQMLQAGNQGIELAGLRNAMAGQNINAQLGAAGVPGNFAQGLGNIGQIMGLGGQIAGAFTGMGPLLGAGRNLFNRGGYGPGPSGSYGPSDTYGYG